MRIEVQDRATLRAFEMVLSFPENTPRKTVSDYVTAHYPGYHLVRLVEGK